MKMYAKKEKRGCPASARPRFEFFGCSHAVGHLTSVANWKQPCVARVSSAEVKGGGVRNAAEVGRVWCHPCSRRVSTAGCIGVGGGL